MVTFTLNTPSNDNPRQTLDTVIPFLLNLSRIRGRMAKLGPSIDHILSRHRYPVAVSRLLGEVLVVATLLGTMLKREGLVTVQVKGKGPINFLVADCTHDGKLRGYANLSKEANFKKIGTKAGLKALLGEGYLAITLDYATGEQRYQGIVPLDYESITACVKEYFHRSEQINTILKLAVGKQKTGTKMHWYAGGILVQHLPEEGGKSSRAQHAHHDKWETADVFIESVQDKELLGPSLSSDQLLYRLFHLDGVWIYDPIPLTDQCRCSRTKIERFLVVMSDEDIAASMKKGKIEVNCEFCGKTERFTAEDVATLKQEN